MRVRAISAGCAVLLLASVVASSGQTGTTQRSATAVPVSSTTASVSRVEYAVTHGAGDPRQNWMDLYLPVGGRTERLALVILVHGGAWRSRVGADSFTAFAFALAARHVAVLNVEYRRVGQGGGWPSTFSDVADAIAAVPSIAGRHPSIDIHRSVVVGHSAGAQLAVWAATRRPHCCGVIGAADAIGAQSGYRPAVAFSIAGPLDLRRAVRLGDRNPARALGGMPTQVPDRYASVDPIENVNPAVPVIAVIGSADTVVPGSLTFDYASAVRSVGGHVRVVTFAGQTHSSIVRTTSPTFPRLVDEIVNAAQTSVTPRSPTGK